MVKPASHVFTAVFLAVPIVALSACSPPGEVPSDQRGTTPSVWTGSPPPSGSMAHEVPGTETLRAQLRGPDGTAVATATFDFANGYATVTVETATTGVLPPGFHGLHIHAAGKCEGDFNSAGGHLQVPGHTTHPASGDLTSLQVRSDGTAKLVTTTDAFTAEDLQAGEKTAIIIHEKSDNFANIPPEKYSQVNGTPGPDEATLATGDAGKRLACGVIGTG